MLVCGKSADIIKITATIKIVLLTTTMFAKNKGNGIHKPFFYKIYTLCCFQDFSNSREMIVHL